MTKKEFDSRCNRPGAPPLFLIYAFIGSSILLSPLWLPAYLVGRLSRNLWLSFLP